jgi:exonuclease III
MVDDSNNENFDGRKTAGSGFNRNTSKTLYPVLKVLKISTFNIQHGGNSNLEKMIRCTKKMNIDIILLTETKLQGIHTQSCEGYDIVATIAKSRHQGGVALCYRKSNQFHLEDIRQHGYNVISSVLATGNTKYLLVGRYIPPSETDMTTIEELKKATKRVDDMKLEIILLGDFNIDLKSGNFDSAMENAPRLNETASLISTLQLQDLNNHFQQKKGVGDWTWHAYRNNIHYIHRNDYALVSDIKKFSYYKIKTPRYCSDHRMIVVGLKIDNHQKYIKYMQRRNRLNVQIKNQTRTDIVLEELASSVERKQQIMDHQYNSWIAIDTWILINKKAEARRCGNIEYMKQLGQLIRRHLKQDRNICIGKTAIEIELLLDDNLIREAYARL